MKSENGILHTGIVTSIMRLNNVAPFHVQLCQIGQFWIPLLKQRPSLHRHNITFICMCTGILPFLTTVPIRNAFSKPSNWPWATVFRFLLWMPKIVDFNLGVISIVAASDEQADANCCKPRENTIFTFWQSQKKKKTFTVVVYSHHHYYRQCVIGTMSNNPTASEHHSPNTMRPLEEKFTNKQTRTPTRRL